MIIVLIRKLLREWRIRRDPIRYARSIGVHIGNDCRLLGLQDTTFGSEPNLITIGHHVTITEGVRFITHDGGVWVFRQQHPDIDVIAPISVGNNVFIGLNTIILPGVSVGDNCVIGAGSIVTKDIPSNYVAAGIPARCLRTIDEYWSDVEAKALHIRSYSKIEKKHILDERFNGS